MNLSSLKYIFLSIVLGFVAITAMLDYDQPFKEYVEYHVKRIFLDSFKSVLQGKVKHVWLLWGEIELEQVRVTPPDGNDAWHWQAEQFILKFSWLSFLLKKKFDVTVSLDTLDAHSHLYGSSIPIIDHLQTFIAAAAGFPATLKRLTIQKGHFTLIDQDHAVNFDTFFNGSYGNINGWMQLHVTTQEGAVTRNNQKICDNFCGSLHVSIPDVKNNVIEASISGKLAIPHLGPGKNICHIDGQWQRDTGQFFLHSADNSYALTLYNWTKTAHEIAGDVTCTVPLDYLNQLLPSLQNLMLEGRGQCQAHIRYSDYYDIEGTLAIDDVHSYGHSLGRIHAEIERSHGCWHGSCRSFYSNVNSPDIEADFRYHEKTQAGQLHLTNSLPLAVANWVIDAQDCSLFITMADMKGTGTYSCKFINSVTKVPFGLQGTLTLSPEKGTSVGSVNNKKFEAEVVFAPYPLLTHCTVYEKVEKPLIDIHTNENNLLEGTFDFGLFQEVTQNLFDYKIPGQGTVYVSAQLDGATINASIDLLKGNIRIPETYTIIRGVKGSLSADLIKRTIVISDAFLELDKGSLVCQRAVIELNKNGIPSFIYAPCTIKKAFLTVQKELFAVFSGNIIWTQTEGKGSELKGKIIIDRGYFKKNIFAQLGVGQKKIVDFGNARSDLNQQCHLDISLETKNPLEVKTSFLETQVQIGIALQGTLQNPELSGSLGLENGTLAFPYRPLSITHGMIYFLPHQLYDPIVELIAKGKIRKYQVTLRCNGSLQHPHISFESTPPLTEEQVITLLLAGSEEGSLSLAMPAMIMQKLQNVIFGPEQPASKLEGYFKSLLEPLKHIRFIPGFSDQSGRGGFRGSIEIDVNDQLRGMIQKNFSLSEDIKLEVEYFLSDDITVRGMRDERGDFGGEVEMRWKF